MVLWQSACLKSAIACIVSSSNHGILVTMQPLHIDQIEQFKKIIYDFYALNRREFSWRQDITAYKVVVSEVMLQQTQTSRVIEKFQQWIEKFPDFQSLAQASNHDVLTAWQGLGYNRRGLSLAKIAQIVMQEHQGILPSDPHVLQTLPSIGSNTAGSISAFAFNKPTVFIETNIRTVYTHIFFQGQTEISDKQLLPIIEQSVDRDNPREWYYALMDYGVHLKQKLPRINAASKHYTKQSKFEGSKRQVRGMIIKILTACKSTTWDELIDVLTFHLPENLHNKNLIIQNLIDEKIIHLKHDRLSL